MNQGRYSAALTMLEDTRSAAVIDPRSQIIRAELYERTGRLSEAKRLTRSIAQQRHVNPGDLSTCELVAGRIAWEHGDTAAAISHTQRAIDLASEANNLHQKAWTQA